MAVDLNPESIVENDAQLAAMGVNILEQRDLLIGNYLIVSKDDGGYLVSTLLFHDNWKFVDPYEASRVSLRDIVRR